MRIDASIAFVPVGVPQSLVGAAGVSFPSVYTVDLLGSGVGTAPTVIFGTPSVYGSADAAGVGLKRVEMAVAVGTAFATSNSATLNVQLQGAIDTGSGGGYQPGTWNTFVETGTITAANLTAGSVIMRFPWLPPFPFNLRPRYLRLNFSIPSGTNFTAGTIAYAVPTLGRDDFASAYAARNYVVA